MGMISSIGVGGDLNYRVNAWAHHAGQSSSGSGDWSVAFHSTARLRGV
jgi:hypothetical protein